MLRRIRTALKERRTRRLHPYLYDDEVQLPRLAAMAEKTAGRSMAIVGNAESIFAARWGEAIDQHDVVIRINRGFPRRPESQGRRTDLLCLATKIDPEEIEREFGKVPVIFVSFYRSNMSDGMMAESKNLVCYPLGAWEALSKQIDGGLPSAGLKAIDIARRFLGARSVALFGFDWKATKTFYRDELKLGVHDWAAEKKLIDRWAMEGWLRLPPAKETDAKL